MLPNDSPTSPSLAPETNWAEALSAISTACPLTVVPPMVTVSVPTVPEDPEPSAYWISQDAPDSSFQVVLLEGSKTLWFFCEAAGRLVEKTQLETYELIFSHLFLVQQLTDRHFQCRSRGSRSVRQCSLHRCTRHYRSLAWLGRCHPGASRGFREGD